jgi:small subunit ribosomal protein S1
MSESMHETSQMPTGAAPTDESPAKPARVQPPPSPGDLAASINTEPDAALERAVEQALLGVTESDMTGEFSPPPPTDEPTSDAIIKGRIANIGSQDVLIDFGGKSLGAMALAEFGSDEKYSVGDAIEVMLVGEDARSGLLSVSRKKARQTALLRTIKPGMIVEGSVTGMNKGGLEVNVQGLRAFIPASQVDLHFVKDISDLIGKTIKAEVTKFDAADENIVLSRRKYQMQEAALVKDKVFAELELGQVRKGVVRGLTDYGAFVDLGGIDALLHVTDMSWGRVNKAEDVLKVGQEIEAKIIKINRQQKKISLSLKQTLADPWTTVAERYSVGTKITGRVARLATFGAFVELEPGIDGLLPVSEMSWTKRLRSPGEVVKEGDMIEVSVLTVEADKRRISLSLKAATADPWSVAAEQFVAGAMVKGKVVRTTDFGAFVKLTDDIDGLIHISELSELRIKAVTDKVKPGQEVEARVLSVDPTNHKVSLSLRPPPKELSPEEKEKIARERAAIEKASEQRKAKSASRRGGITISWDQGLGSLDPSKFAK